LVEHTAPKRSDPAASPLASPSVTAPASEPGACCGEPAGCGTPGAPPVALTAMRAGQVGAVCETCLDPRDAAMLRAMGLRPRAQLRVCRLGQPCIIEVISAGRGCCRIGLAWDLASRVMVRVVQVDG